MRESDAMMSKEEHLVGRTEAAPEGLVAAGAQQRGLPLLGVLQVEDILID